ncbi:MAG: hypothetical protein LBU32_00685 [Clostridiales bacterium]|nr:hypothetical protein [Clostridiales bacterium]
MPERTLQQTSQSPVARVEYRAQGVASGEENARQAHGCLKDEICKAEISRKCAKELEVRQIAPKWTQHLTDEKTAGATNSRS